jgi:hypothetical protein
MQNVRRAARSPPIPSEKIVSANTFSVSSVISADTSIGVWPPQRPPIKGTSAAERRQSLKTSVDLSGIGLFRRPTRAAAGSAFQRMKHAAAIGAGI